MRIGKTDQPYSAIAHSEKDRITIRGLDLCESIIGKFSFIDYFHFLVLGAKPTDNQRFFTEAVLVAIAEHGLVPTVVASRMTLAAAPDAWQGAVAAGLLGMGSVVAGSSEIAGRFYDELVGRMKAEGRTCEAVARAGLEELKQQKQKVPGLGHPEHSAGDPRANVLLRLADERGVAGDHIRMVRELARLAPEVTGRTLPVNVSGAIPAVMLDIGFPVAAMKGLPLLARTAGLIGHLYEETQRPIGFVMGEAAASAIAYDGPVPAES